MYHDLLIRIKNAQAAHHRVLTAPYAKFDAAVLKVLVDAGYVKNVEKKSMNKKNYLEVTLASSKAKSAINGIKFMSAPSRHIYVKASAVKPVKQGFGIGVVSTSHGVMSTKEARKAGLGGEYLFQIW